MHELIHGPEWYVDEKGHYLVLVMPAGNAIAVVLNDNDVVEDKDRRVKIFEHIKQSYNFLRGNHAS